jgi:hypothetical protein
VSHLIDLYYPLFAANIPIYKYHLSAWISVSTTRLFSTLFYILGFMAVPSRSSADSENPSVSTK